MDFFKFYLDYMKCYWIMVGVDVAAWLAKGLLTDNYDVPTPTPSEGNALMRDYLILLYLYLKHK